MSCTSVILGKRQIRVKENLTTCGKLAWNYHTWHFGNKQRQKSLLCFCCQMKKSFLLLVFIFSQSFHICHFIWFPLHFSREGRASNYYLWWTNENIEARWVHWPAPNHRTNPEDLFLEPRIKDNKLFPPDHDACWLGSFQFSSPALAWVPPSIGSPIFRTTPSAVQ